MVLHVRVDHESSESIVVVFADFILNDGEEVESGKNWGSQVDIVVEIEGHVVGTFQGVCGRYNTASSLETSIDSCFRNGDSLLFHSFVNGGSILIIHLIKLIDQADTFVSQD